MLPEPQVIDKLQRQTSVSAPVLPLNAAMPPTALIQHNRPGIAPELRSFPRQAEHAGNARARTENRTLKHPAHSLPAPACMPG
jgi:hypothetical protein